MVKRFVPISLLVCASSIGAAQTLPRVTATREVVVDGNVHLLSSQGTLAISASGIIYHGESPITVRVFGPDGKLRSEFGRVGSGPGDFRSLFRMGTVGDSVWIFDTNLDRTTIAGPDGRVVRIFKEEEMVVPSGTRLQERKTGGSPIAVLPDGSILLHGINNGFANMRTRYGGYPVVRTTPKATFDRIAGWIPLSGDVIETKEVKDGYLGWLPFPNGPQYAVAPDGSSYVVVVADINADVARGTVTVVRNNGDTVYSQSIPVFAEPIPPEVMDTAYSTGTRGKGLAELADQKNGKRLVEIVRAAPRPRFYPPLRSVAISRSGMVLVGFRSTTSERDYLILDPTGRPVASLQLPARVDPRQFDGTLIWTTERDRDGVPSIVRYRITGLP
jgi:hypothetical protein